MKIGKKGTRDEGREKKPETWSIVASFFCSFPTSSPVPRPFLLP